MKQGQRPDAQRRRSEHRSDWPFLSCHPDERRCQRHVPLSARSRNIPDCMKSIREAGKHSEHPPCLSPSSRDVERNEAGAASVRAMQRGRARLRSGMECSGSETQESGKSPAAVCVCWCMVPRRRPRRTGTSIVAGARVPVPSRAVCRRSSACCAALTGLVNSFVRVTQGVALGYHLAPRWGFGSRCGVCCRRNETKHAPPGISVSAARSACEPHRP